MFSMKLGGGPISAIERYSIMEDWCHDYLGKKYQRWVSFEYLQEEFIYAFKDGEDAIIFKLKWG